MDFLEQFYIFSPMNQSNQYILDLWLIFQNQSVLDIEKLKGKKKKKMNLKCSSKSW